MTIAVANHISILPDRPKYLGIADSIARSVETGRLKAGARLPTHRELAARLGVTIGTVSRAYAEVYRRGLLIGEVGRGTFVRGLRPADTRFAARDAEDPDLIDLSLNLPVPGACSAELARGYATLLKRGRLASMLGYQAHAGSERHRAAGADWMRRFGMDAAKEQVVLTTGAQHAIMIVLAALARPGDVVLAEELTYPGVKAVARMLHLRLEGVAMDHGGIRAEAFEEACRKHRPKLLYCMPTMHNPTAATMSDARRDRIAGIARQYKVAIVEDDTYGFLAANRTRPLASRAPDLGYYLTTLSKSVAPGVRVGYVRCPRSAVAALENAVMTTTWMVSPITAEIATTWIETGSADAAMNWRCREAKARSAIARRILGKARVPERDTYHFWMALPETWRADEFIAQARARGVGIAAPELFTVGRRAAPHAVRICLGATRTRETLERGLAILRELLKSAPPAEASVM